MGSRRGVGGRADVSAFDGVCHILTGISLYIWNTGLGPRGMNITCDPRPSLQRILRRARAPGVSQPGVALHVDAGFVRAPRLLHGVDPEEDGVARRGTMKPPPLHPLTRCLLTQH